MFYSSTLILVIKFVHHPSKSRDPKSETDDESRHPKYKITDRSRSSKFDHPSTALSFLFAHRVSTLRIITEHVLCSFTSQSTACQDSIIYKHEIEVLREHQAEPTAVAAAAPQPRLSALRELWRRASSTRSTRRPPARLYHREELRRGGRERRAAQVRAVLARARGAHGAAGGWRRAGRAWASCTA